MAIRIPELTGLCRWLQTSAFSFFDILITLVVAPAIVSLIVNLALVRRISKTGLRASIGLVAAVAYLLFVMFYSWIIVGL